MSWTEPLLRRTTSRGIVTAMERIDLGPCTAIRHDGGATRCVVLLPGFGYPTRGPVLWFAREVAMALGYSAIEVLGEPIEHAAADPPGQADYADHRAAPIAWLRDCAERALEAAGSAEVVVIGKSLSSMLAAEISDQRLPAAWLTPPLSYPAMAEALGRVRNRALLLGGTADPLWKRDAIPDNPDFEIAEVPGVDHALQVPGDPGGSLDALRQMAQALHGWLQRLESGATAGGQSHERVG